MRGFEDVFRGVPMSVGTALEGVVVAAGLAGLSVGWVETTFDVDEVEDLEHLRRLVEHRSDLAATRAALETLGLLHGTEGEVTVGARSVEPARGMGGGGPG